MGPDEFVTREEFALVATLLTAKIQQQAEFIVEIGKVLQNKGFITPNEFQEILDRVDQLVDSKKLREAKAALREFLTIRNIAKEYLDPLEE